MIDSIEYNNKRIVYYYEQLDNPIIFLHGLNLDSNTIQCNNFKDKNIIKIDLPGFGKSELIQDITIDDIHKIINLITNKLNLELFSIGGFCLGSIIALDYALKYSEKIIDLHLFELMIYFSTWLILTESTMFKKSYERIINNQLLCKIISGLNLFKDLDWLKTNYHVSRTWSLKSNNIYLNLMKEYSKINHLKRCQLLNKEVYLYQSEYHFKAVDKTAKIISSNLKICHITILPKQSHFSCLKYFNTFKSTTP